MDKELLNPVIQGQLAVILDLQELVRKSVHEDHATPETCADATEALEGAINGYAALTGEAWGSIREIVEDAVEDAVARLEEDEEPQPAP